MEIPFATIPKVRIPISLSFMQLIGAKDISEFVQTFWLT